LRRRTGIGPSIGPSAATGIGRKACGHWHRPKKVAAHWTRTGPAPLTMAGSRPCAPRGRLSQSARGPRSAGATLPRAETRVAPPAAHARPPRRACPRRRSCLAPPAYGRALSLGHLGGDVPSRGIWWEEVVARAVARAHLVPPGIQAGAKPGQAGRLRRNPRVSGHGAAATAIRVTEPHSPGRARPWPGRVRLRDSDCRRASVPAGRPGPGGPARYSTKADSCRLRSLTHPGAGRAGMGPCAARPGWAVAARARTHITLNGALRLMAARPPTDSNWSRVRSSRNEGRWWRLMAGGPHSSPPWRGSSRLRRRTRLGCTALCSQVGAGQPCVHRWPMLVSTRLRGKAGMMRKEDSAHISRTCLVLAMAAGVKLKPWGA
jgi:hypothetical protein